ncbi:MAG: tRNA uridine-5-carboxymethylaminomethyl(34) synthesis GTPase MnmE [Opitutaceae bacterium]|nr:tRNA uridine-5-carboxymethylaminomethyl(34) synthesis GTPase MnmE [Opitutaceae bacterium]
MPPNQDTIAALATPAGASAIALIRISGSDTRRIATDLCGTLPHPRAAWHGDYRALGGELLDDVLFTFFKGPASYTGEDSLEVSSHGNPFIVHKVLSDLFARGCRPAEPGEFSRRAFLNGKMDLSQAEAVMDLINARSDRALAAAHAQLRGGLGQRMTAITTEVVDVVARIEAYIDFPEDDLPPEDRALLEQRMDRIVLMTNALIATSSYGELLREGAKTVIIGAANAGKSSLLNALVGRDRAIVSPEPGTTRDFIEDAIIVGAHKLRIIDTAGFNPIPAPIERLGQAKTLELVSSADLLLIVVDRTLSPPPTLPPDALRLLKPESTVWVLNKSDLPEGRGRDAVKEGHEAIEISALTGDGIDRLRNAIVAKLDGFQPNQSDSIAISSRHTRALGLAQVGLQDAQAKLRLGSPLELVASDLRSTLGAVGEITGRIDHEEVLNRLFATFCIGK